MQDTAPCESNTNTMWSCSSIVLFKEPKVCDEVQDSGRLLQRDQMQKEKWLKSKYHLSGFVSMFTAYAYAVNIMHIALHVDTITTWSLCDFVHRWVVLWESLHPIATINACFVVCFGKVKEKMYATISHPEIKVTL